MPRPSGLLKTSLVMAFSSDSPLNKRAAGDYFPSKAGLDSCASSCSGNSAGSLAPYMRCDVRVADLQSVRTLRGLDGKCQRRCKGHSAELPEDALNSMAISNPYEIPVSGAAA